MINRKLVLQVPVTELDVKTDAVSVLNSACRAVKAILDKREKLDCQGLGDETLVVLAGEVHTLPADQIHHILVTDGLQKQEPDIAVTCERPHDILTSKFSEYAGVGITRKTGEAIYRYDQRGEFTLKTQLGLESGFHDANFSHFAFYHALLRRNIPVKFTDVASLMPERVNYMDSSSAKSLHCCFGEGAHRNVGSRSPEGIYVRNHHMFYQTLAYMDEHRPRIVFAQCGNTHIMGKKGKHEYAHSLAAFFKGADVPVIAMPILVCNGLNDNTIPDGHKLEDDELLLLQPFSDITAIYDRHRKRSKRNADIQSEFLEAAYTNGMLRETGLDDDRISIRQRDEIKNTLSGDMTRTFRQWKKELCPSLWIWL